MSKMPWVRLSASVFIAASVSVTLCMYPPRHERTRICPLGWTVSNAGSASVIDCRRR